LTEHDAAAPTDAYGRSELEAEATVRSAGVPFTILRPSLLYGPGAKGNFALLARVAASPLPLPLKDFGNRRSLLDIDNFISALAFVLAALRQAKGRRPLTLPMPRECFEIPLRLLGRADLWERLNGNLRVDAGKLLAAGWRPPHDTLSGLATTVVTPPDVSPAPDRPPP